LLCSACLRRRELVSNGTLIVRTGRRPGAARQGTTTPQRMRHGQPRRGPGTYRRPRPHQGSPPPHEAPGSHPDQDRQTSPDHGGQPGSSGPFGAAGQPGPAPASSRGTVPGLPEPRLPHDRNVDALGVRVVRTACARRPARAIVSGESQHHPFGIKILNFRTDALFLRTGPRSRDGDGRRWTHAGVPARDLTDANEVVSGGGCRLARPELVAMGRGELRKGSCGCRVQKFPRPIETCLRGRSSLISPPSARMEVRKAA
jgi:hypothetical protein